MAKADAITPTESVLTRSPSPLMPSSATGDMAERLTDVLSALRRAVKDIDDEMDITGDGEGIRLLVDLAQDYAECLRAFVTQSKTRWNVFAGEEEHVDLLRRVNEAAT